MNRGNEKVILSLYEQGFSIKQISLLVNMSSFKINRIIRKNNQEFKFNFDKVKLLKQSFN